MHKFILLIDLFEKFNFSLFFVCPALFLFYLQLLSRTCTTYFPAPKSASQLFCLDFLIQSYGLDNHSLANFFLSELKLRTSFMFSTVFEMSVLFWIRSWKCTGFFFWHPWFGYQEIVIVQYCTVLYSTVLSVTFLNYSTAAFFLQI